VELNLNGYTELPAGKIAAVVTYLEMTSRPELGVGAAPAGLSLERQAAVDIAEYRRLFRAIGEPWLWFSRLNMSDEQLGEVLSKPAVELWYLLQGGQPKGLLELDRSNWPAVEIVFFGVVPELVGQGAGGWLMRRGLEQIWAQEPKRVWLHTCTLDHPRAVGFYMKHGFRAYRRALEVADDPRLTGRLPKDAAPGTPLL